MRSSVIFARSLLCAAVLTATPLVCAAPAVAGDGAGPALSLWQHRGFEDPAGPNPAAVETFLNTTCRPAGLDGIQTFAIQSGHGSQWNLHVWCRFDGAAGVHYKVTMVEFAKAAFAGPMLAAVARPNVRIGPFYFGYPATADHPAGQDGVLLIEVAKP